MGRKAKFYGKEVSEGQIECQVCGEQIKRASAAAHVKSKSCKWTGEKRAMVTKGWARVVDAYGLLKYWPKNVVTMFQPTLATTWFSRGGWGTTAHVSRDYHLPREAVWLCSALDSALGMGVNGYNAPGIARVQTWFSRMFSDQESFDLAVFVFRALHEEAITQGGYGLQIPAHAKAWAERVAVVLDLPPIPDRDALMREEAEQRELYQEAERAHRAEAAARAHDAAIEQIRRDEQRERWFAGLPELVEQARKALTGGDHTGLREVLARVYGDLEIYGA